VLRPHGVDDRAWRPVINKVWAGELSYVNAAAEAVAAASTAWRSGMAALPWVWRRELNDGERDEVRHGRSVERGEVLPPPGSACDSGEGTANPVALYASDDLLAIAEERDGRLHPKKVFPA